jgi:hypothetical protein
VAGKLGRRSPKNAPALKFSAIYKGTIPSHPAQADYLNLGQWAMLGNDTYGDCVAVTWANERRLLTYQNRKEYYPNLDQVFTFYRTQNPDFPRQDEGMDIQTALETLLHDGGPDGVKCLAFAKVDHNDLDEVKAALAIFGCVWIGINVQSDQFDANQPWDYVQGSPDDGGHSIIGGGYDSDMTAGDVTFVTWAQETSFTDSFWKHKVEECWVVIWPEHLTSQPFLEGVDQNALGEAYKSITGRDFPVPVPPAADPDAALAAVAKDYLATGHHSHKLLLRLKKALSDWLAAHE